MGVIRSCFFLFLKIRGWVGVGSLACEQDESCALRFRDNDEPRLPDFVTQGSRAEGGDRSRRDRGTKAVDRVFLVWTDYM